MTTRTLFTGAPWLPIDAPAPVEGIEADPIVREHRAPKPKVYNGPAPPTSEQLEMYRQHCYAKCEETNEFKTPAWSQCITVCAREVSVMNNNAFTVKVQLQSNEYAKHSQGQ
ncbi:hypothetical protein DIPPA_18785 [Diplonema papillatum]|nr:hypothetical protein DIPPA_18785 [Diplonema papillatum]